jgi:plasmid stabilization system protein ParE
VPQVDFAPGAIRDLKRLRELLRPKIPAATKRAAETIIGVMRILELQPQIGRPVADMPEEYRDGFIDFGDSGYVARYRIGHMAVAILTVRHQKEVGFNGLSH